jgi:hypothetical protein
MSDPRPADFGATATLEMRVYRHGVLVHRELCESEAEAAALAEAWEEEPGTECEVDDLSAPRHDVEALEIDRDDVEEYPTTPEGGVAPTG